MEHIIARRIQNRSRSAQLRIETLRLHRTLRDMSDPFNDPHFVSLYRLPPSVALNLIADIKEFYPIPLRTDATPVQIKFLSALHFFAQGSYQKPDGRDAVISLSQASVCRFISETTQALNCQEVLSKWVRFPNTNEQHQIIEKNYRKFGLPGVLGFVDGTHILIKKPVMHEELYVNRKGQHSLNVQMVCDSDLQILNLLSKYPGSSHDAFIWKASMVREKMKAASGCWLLGDSGYPSEPWLLTPILNAPEGSNDAKYTRMHILARNCIERCFGVLKGRFRCLSKNRVLEYCPEKSGRIVNACAVLHNICIKYRISSDIDVIEENDHEDNYEQIEEQLDQETLLLQRGLQVRAALINRL